METIHLGCFRFRHGRLPPLPDHVVAMANSLIGHNKQRDARSLTPIAVKGKGEVQIVQLSTREVEAKWIAKKVKALVDAGGPATRHHRAGATEARRRGPRRAEGRCCTG